MKNTGQIVVSVKNAYQALQQKNSVIAVVLLAGLSIALLWFTYSLEPVWNNINMLFSGGEEGTASWGSALRHLLPSLITLLVLYFILTRKYGNPPREEVIAKQGPPEKHKGLIYLLGPYRPRGREFVEQYGVPATLAELEHALDLLPAPEIRDKLMLTTWGPLWISVEAHWPQLTHCWLVSTEGTDGTIEEAPVAEKLIHKALSMGKAQSDVQCFYDDCTVKNGFSVGDVVPRIDYIYSWLLPAQNLEEDDVIADFTGGTKAMTAGMILATLDQIRKIQYLRQDTELFRVEGEQGRGVTAVEILHESMLVFVETWRELAPVLRKAPPG